MENKQQQQVPDDNDYSEVDNYINGQESKKGDVPF